MTVYCKDFFFRFCRKIGNSLCKQPDLPTLGHIQYMHWMCILKTDFCHSSAPQEQSATRQQVRRQFSTFPAGKPNLLPRFFGQKKSSQPLSLQAKVFSWAKTVCAGKGWREKTKRWGEMVKKCG